MTDSVITVALAGNPNVGKSTIFNALTGLKQHTGNWAGKTVGNAEGESKYKDKKFVFVDIPGTYSLLAHSKEEEIARDFLCFSSPDKIVVVCDATCIERNMNLVLQTLEISENVVVCVNLLDEAKRKHIKVDLKKLSSNLGVEVVGTNASKKDGIDELLKTLSKNKKNNEVKKVQYIPILENQIQKIQKVIEKENLGININARWLAIKLIEADKTINESIKKYTSKDVLENENIKNTVAEAKKFLKESGFTKEKIKDEIAVSIGAAADESVKGVVSVTDEKYLMRDRKIDRILTGKITGVPFMALLLATVLWITIWGANIPSELLGDILFEFENVLLSACIKLKIPEIIYNPLIFGMYRVLSWVVSVMLPPMAIFFPLFTFLEDLGYLPRIAFNLDKTFKKCNACGKQALTMCMGFGCNAVGVTGARIIDSERERIIAILTNSFVPCNGRFPFLVAIISMFLITANSSFSTFFGALILTSFIIIGIFVTFLVSSFLSKTFLKGTTSAFTLELPPYRKPKITQIIVKSVVDRMIFVLGRAVTAAAPAGLIIWFLANITIKDITLLNYISTFLDPFGKLLGLDGVILLAFVLGLPANEIVLPIIIMAYMSKASLVKIEDLSIIKNLFVQNGWTTVTAVCTMVFSLFHWPCATTLMTVKKETKSLKWTFLSLAIPSIVGMTVCFLISTISKLF